ncbi:MAG: hypothetical protein ABIB93_05330, partial [Chloroflexota bacterium]
ATIGAFIIAALLFLVAVGAAIFLIRYINKNKGYTRQIGLYLRRGYTLRREILDLDKVGIIDNAPGEKVTQWENDAQQWLDSNLPDYAPDFPLETLTSTTSYFFYDGVSTGVSTAALRLESRLSNLREILRDVRR